MAIKREKRLTKRERKAAAPPRPASTTTTTTGNRAQASSEQHIHCVACGRHLDPAQFDAPATATTVQCQHKSTFASCVGCVPLTRKILEEHDRTGEAVKAAAAWH